MINIRKISITAFMVLSLHFPLYSISQQMADVCTFFTSLACIGGSYKVWKNMDSTSNLAMLCGGTSLVVTGLAYSFFHSMTPAGRLKHANGLLDEVWRHTLARVDFDNEGQFFDAVHNEYLREDLPLIGAYNHLMNLLPTVHLAFGLINKAAVEVDSDPVLQSMYNSSLSCANQVFKNISKALRRIREHKDYLPQLALYKESLNGAKQTIAQEQMALAQLQMAQAQQSSTFLKWLKAIFQLH